MSNEKNQPEQEERDMYDFKYDDDVDPLELVGNASLSLHHHMAPPDDDLEDTPE